MVQTTARPTQNRQGTGDANANRDVFGLRRSSFRAICSITSSPPDFATSPTRDYRDTTSITSTGGLPRAGDENKMYQNDQTNTAQQPEQGSRPRAP